MSQYNNTTSQGKYKHLIESERYKIEGYLKDGKKPREIAALIGKSTRTVQREIKLGKAVQMNSDLTIRHEYLADYAALKRREAAKNKGPARKLGKFPELRAYIEAQILEKRHTPDIVVGRMRLEGIQFGATVCTKTVYNAIDAGVFENLTNKDLPVKRKPVKNKHKTVRISHKNLKGASIDDRPPEIDDRGEYGHWEMDLVLSGKGHKAALLTLTERMSREEIIAKIWDKSQKSVQKAVDDLEKALGSGAFRAKFKTITIDNGSEFLDFKGLEASTGKGPARTKVYYAHPYSAWERGSNENHNGMIRRKIPKGSNIGVYSAKRVKDVQGWMNNYPRRILGYMTPNEVAEREMAKAA